MKYSGVGLFKHHFHGSKQISQFEERVVLTEADSLEAVRKKIFEEFRHYCIEGTEFLNEYEIVEVRNPEFKDVIEVSCSMKVFDGTDEEYIARYWDDQRPESCDDLGWTHSWHNRKEGISGCYNCQEERTGELWRDSL
jgi:hypothetical protein